MVEQARTKSTPGTEFLKKWLSVHFQKGTVPVILRLEYDQGHVVSVIPFHAPGEERPTGLELSDQYLP